jgi:hypothetical protein
MSEPLIVKPGAYLLAQFCIVGAAGAPVNADSLPTCTWWRGNQTAGTVAIDSSVTVTVATTGVAGFYKIIATVPAGYVSLDTIQVQMAATVATVPIGGIVCTAVVFVPVTTIAVSSILNPVVIAPTASGTIPAGITPAMAGQSIDFAINYPISQQFVINNVDATSWTQADLTIKNIQTDLDSAALIAVKVSNPPSGSDGLFVLNGTIPSGSTTAADATLSVTTASSTQLAITFVATARGAAIPAGSYFGEITLYKGTGKAPWLGAFAVEADQTLRINPVAS